MTILKLYELRNLTIKINQYQSQIIHIVWKKIKKI